MFKKSSCLILFCAALIGATGCTTAPTQTHADIPLVHTSLSYSLTPEEQAINIPLVNLQSGTKTPLSVDVDGTQYISTKQYISATGNKCIRFSSVQKSNNVNTAKHMTTCQRDGQWRIIAPLVAPSSQNG